MLRQIIAIVTGYAVWTMLWLGFGGVLRAMEILPRAETIAIESTPPLLVLVASSIIASLVAGFVVASITRSAATAAVLILGLLLLATGIFVELRYWQLMPVWYHVVFLVLLVPVCIVGARLRSTLRRGAAV
jgi:hypothetical protein